MTTPFVRKPITLNSLRAVLTEAAVAVKGETACIDTATGLFHVAGVSATLIPVGTFTESITGDGVKTTLVQTFEEIRAQEWINDGVAPIAIPTNFGGPAYIKDGRTVTATALGHSKAGIVVGIDSTGRVMVAPRPFFTP
jgi:hypothetical protein